MTCGIYKLSFIGTDKVYIGQSENIEYRYASHINTLKKNKGAKKLQEAYNIFGKPVLEIVLECDREELSYLENEAIEIFNSYKNGFNSQEFADEVPILVGEEHPNSKYSNSQVEQAFLLLTEKHLTHQEIADITGISKYMINHIAIGTAHSWLSSKYPDKYKNLIKSKPASGCSKERGRIYRPVIGPDGTEYNIENLRQFAREHSIPYSSLNALVNGKTNQVRGYTLKSIGI